MLNTEKIHAASNALLAMQRHSWEQGVAMQAFLEMGRKDLVLPMAWEAVYRSLPDGRAAVMDNDHGSTDPCAVGEALAAAVRWSEDQTLKEGLDRLLEWALYKAPRNEKGVVYHLADSKEFWADSLYMLPPFLAVMGHVDEALVNFYGYMEALYDPDAHLMGHMWDDGKGSWIRGAHWGTGNGWTMAACARMIPLVKKAGYDEDAGKIAAAAKDLLDHLLPWMREDGSFGDVVDDKDSFSELNLSQMLAYTIYRGLNDGWLKEEPYEAAESYAAAARKMRQAANDRLDPLGFISPVCGAPTFDRPGYSPEAQAFYMLMEHEAQIYEKEI